MDNLHSKHYVLAFGFDKRPNKLVVVEKNRPEFQAGKLNAPGGKIESQDGPGSIEVIVKNAVIREFKEETGVSTNKEQWDYFAEVTIEADKLGGSAVIHCLRMFDNDIYEAKTMETEPVYLVDPFEIIAAGASQFAVEHTNIMPNMPALTMLAKNRNVKFAKITLRT